MWSICACSRLSEGAYGNIRALWTDERQSGHRAQSDKQGGDVTAGINGEEVIKWHEVQRGAGTRGKSNPDHFIPS